MCSKLSWLEIPDGVKNIGFAAFSNCSSLKNLYLPQSLDFLHIGTFEGCPNSLLIMGYKNSCAEYFCEQHGFRFYDLGKTDENIFINSDGVLRVKENISMSDLIVLPSYTKKSQAINSRKIITTKQIFDAQNLKSKKVILPEQLEIIGANSFKNNFFIESAECPVTLKNIGISAFAGDINLKTINLNEGLEEIGLSAFRDCERLSEIELPSSLKILGARAFENCVSLTRIKIPKYISMLDNFAFAGTGLKQINIPGNVSLCESSFYNCRELISADFSEGVKIIQGTFDGCSSLEYVTIPSSVILITRSSFSGCKNLKDVWIYSDKAELNIPDNYDKINTRLFADSPNLTIHAHIGSTAHLYAMSNNIKFSPIHKNENENAVTRRKNFSFKSSEQIYSDKELRQMCSFNYVHDAAGCWELFQYSLGYGFKDLIYGNLESCQAKGNDYDKICVGSAKKFLEQSEYKSGLVIRCFFDESGNYSEHSDLKAGDIITEIDGVKIQSKYDFYEDSRKSDKDLTLLRANDKGRLQKINVKIRADEKLFTAVQGIIPLTFEKAQD